MIINTKTGFCPENCGYCAQSIESTAPIQKYRMLDEETIIKGAEKAVELNSGTYCIVASGRGPTNRELDTVTSAVKEIKEKHEIKVCACLGILRPGQAEKELAADSIPLNFLHSIDGIKLEGTQELSPTYCLKVLSMFRFMNPTKEIRISSGREVNLRSLQPLDYLQPILSLLVTILQ